MATTSAALQANFVFLSPSTAFFPDELKDFMWLCILKALPPLLSILYISHILKFFLYDPCTTRKMCQLLMYLLGHNVVYRTQHFTRAHMEI